MLGQNTERATERGHIDLSHNCGVEEGLVSSSECQLHVVRVGAILAQTSATHGQQTSVSHERHLVLEK